MVGYGDEAVHDDAGPSGSSAGWLKSSLLGRAVAIAVELQLDPYTVAGWDWIVIEAVEDRIRDGRKIQDTRRYRHPG